MYSSSSKKGRKLHAQAEKSREEGAFLKALIYIDKAILAYQKDKDMMGLAEVLSSRQSTYKLLYRKTKDKVFLILEKYAAKASIAVAEKTSYRGARAIPYHNLGKYYFESKKYKKAAFFFNKALYYLKKYKPPLHYRPSVLLDIEGHKYASLYLSGDKSALEQAERILKKLKKSKEKDTYAKHVWLTGAHLRIAYMVYKDNIELAREHLRQAYKIISKDKRLVIRNQEYRRIRSLIGQ